MAQPRSFVCVERAIRLAGGADAEVIGPPVEHAVQLFTSSVVSCQVRARTVSAWTVSTMRWMLFFDGRRAKRPWPVVRKPKGGRLQLNLDLDADRGVRVPLAAGAMLLRAFVAPDPKAVNEPRFPMAALRFVIWSHRVGHACQWQ